MVHNGNVAMVSPVSVGDFGDGPDIMLWNPHVSRARWRRETARAALPPRVVLCGLLGAGLVAEAVAWETGFGAVLAIGLGLAALGGATFAAVVNVACFATDHAHDRGRRCRLEQCPGEFFYRTQDFTDLGIPVRDTVSSLIDAVGQLYATPARAWLDPGLPREAHLVAWDALRYLDRTRTTRALADQLCTEPDAGELAARANDAVTVIDRALAEVLWHLRGCVTLTQAWTAKLHHADLEARLQATLDALRDGQAAQLAATAETLPQTVFAYITAARDVTGTGPFPWEQPAPAHSRTRLPRARANTDASERRRSLVMSAGPRVRVLVAGWRRWWAADRGSVAAEAVLVAPVLVMLLVFIAVVIHRGVDARLRLDDAAHQAARAASMQRTTPAATTAARDTAAAALSDAGVVCRNVATTTTETFKPGGTVTVTVRCTVDFGQALLLSVPSTRTLQATASEVIDSYRSDPSQATGSTP